jgi:protein-S-isoprenylcysteine O-methyltransferase Ste14
MIKIIIFFIFSLIMLKISRPDQEIEEALQPSSDIADSQSPEQSMEEQLEERDNLSIFQRFMLLLRSLPSLAMELRDCLVSETHGRKFYRFFALEFVFLLILVNFGYWLKNPFTLFRLITWLILCGSLVLAGYAIFHLLLFGKPQLSDDIEIPNKLTLSEIYKSIRHPLYTSRIALTIETTTNLVTRGAFKYIRHPLYASLILLGAVTLIKNPSMLATSLFGAAAVFIYATARVEEKENLIKFGDDYAVYMKRSRMFFSVSIFEKILGEE